VASVVLPVAPIILMAEQFLDFPQIVSSPPPPTGPHSGVLSFESIRDLPSCALLVLTIPFALGKMLRQQVQKNTTELNFNLIGNRHDFSTAGVSLSLIGGSLLSGLIRELGRCPRPMFQDWTSR
jgi:hypothetical protein